MSAPRGRKALRWVAFGIAGFLLVGSAVEAQMFHNGAPKNLGNITAGAAGVSGYIRDTVDLIDGEPYVVHVGPSVDEPQILIATGKVSGETAIHQLVDGALVDRVTRRRGAGMYFRTPTRAVRFVGATEAVAAECTSDGYPVLILAVGAVSTTAPGVVFGINNQGHMVAVPGRLGQHEPNVAIIAPKSPSDWRLELKTVTVGVAGTLPTKVSYGNFQGVRVQRPRVGQHPDVEVTLPPTSEWLLDLDPVAVGQAGTLDDKVPYGNFQRVHVQRPQLAQHQELLITPPAPKPEWALDVKTVSAGTAVATDAKVSFGNFQWVSAQRPQLGSHQPARPYPPRRDIDVPMP